MREIFASATTAISAMIKSTPENSVVTLLGVLMFAAPPVLARSVLR
jgi:hypothetical protein